MAPHRHDLRVAARPKDRPLRAPCPGADLGNERSVLEAFFTLLTSDQDPPRLVSWNGSGFDLPVIRYRAMLHGIPAPGLYRSDGEFQFNDYQNRYHDMHVDLMDTLSGYGASTRVGLGNWCRTIGLSGKSFLDREVYEHILDGELSRVIEYLQAGYDRDPARVLGLCPSLRRAGSGRSSSARRSGARDGGRFAVRGLARRCRGALSMATLGERAEPRHVMTPLAAKTAGAIGLSSASGANKLKHIG